MKAINTILAASMLFSGIALSSCDDNDNDNGTNGGSYINIVTLTANNTTGSVMTFQEKDDSPLITLTSNQQFDSRIFKPNTRVVVNYTPLNGNGYSNGAVVVNQAMNTEGLGAPVEAKTATETENWASDPVNMYMVQRSGEYINLIFTASTKYDPKECAVYVDQATIGTDTPCLYLVFEASDSSAAEPYYFYASYSIADVWNAASTKSVRIYYPDLKSTQAYFEMIKESSSLKPNPDL